MKNNKTWIIVAGISGFLAVAIGAFGAHGLSDSLSASMLDVYKTGVLYHLVHSVAILAIAISGREIYYKSALLFAMGIFLFSFSLYVYAITGVTAIAIITPFGGLCFLAGWLLIVFSALRESKEK